METFNSINWKEEAKRLQVAFDIGQPCEFRLDPKVNSRAFFTATNSFPSLSEGAFKVRYDEFSRNFTVIHSFEMRKASGLFVGWNGSVSASSICKTPGYAIAQGLFCLGLLTQEAEAALKTTVSAHQKLEWLEAYEYRLALPEIKLREGPF